MDEGHELICYTVDEGHWFYELSLAGATATEFSKLQSDRRTQQIAMNLISQICKIQDSDLSTACMTGKMRCLDAKEGLYEIKGFAGAQREMAYVVCAGKTDIVLLGMFKGHQGKSGNISRQIKKSIPLARKANKLLKEKVSEPQEKK